MVLDTFGAIREWFVSTSISEIRDIGDEHSAIAATTVRLACERAEAHDLERLQELARALVLARTPEVRASADSRFHVELAVSAQSPRLANAEIRLQEESVLHLWAPLGGEPDPETATAEHLELVRAVAQDQPERAQKLELEHIRRNIFHLIDTRLTLSYAQSTQEPNETGHRCAGRACPRQTTCTRTSVPRGCATKPFEDRMR
ncbi:FCD domain-containing protein [Paenarthrobacter sp. PH39-S1]|uniref:FadR/GntR family transcriptional regulator n=1 Tax=Paenarthrobacter sp. PH39-S1 TaxID=3046204 RepID=UPI0024BA6D32|nr:FCD domain-containing protein [Paenarthrobacter sp. PH39-S1]MDJ0358414.1 FCD domain-containing protein [Paenarthrobacter sp. PH39-S1]